MYLEKIVFWKDGKQLFSIRMPQRKGRNKSCCFQVSKGKCRIIRHRCLRFINRKNVDPNSYLFICEKHFEEKYLNKQNNQRVRLCNAKNPVPTIHPPSIVKTTPSVLPTLSTPRKPPKARVYGEDEINNEAFKSTAIAIFSKVNESLLKSLGNGFLFSKNEDCAILYRFWHKQYSCAQSMWND